jgi:hypothetical protein
LLESSLLVQRPVELGQAFPITYTREAAPELPVVVGNSENDAGGGQCPDGLLAGQFLVIRNCSQPPICNPGIFVLIYWGYFAFSESRYGANGHFQRPEELLATLIGP